MPDAALYRGAYPLPGDVAVLCEGDLLGYEASLLKRWFASQGAWPHADVLPCGTREALVGFSDAIGRAVPLLAIEDRDFRSVAEAEKDCKDQRGRREERGLRVLDWRAWRRNEIENYLLEPAVVQPCLAQVFGCQPQDVAQLHAQVVGALRLWQAAEHCLYQARRRWQATAPTAVLAQDLARRPKWRDDQGDFAAPEIASAREQLSTNLKRWQDDYLSATGAKSPEAGVGLLDTFDAKWREWEHIDPSGDVCLTDWCGKEVLYFLLVGLSGRFGWPDPETGVRVAQRWSGLGRPGADAQVRRIEDAVKPALVARFLEHLAQLREGALYGEWTSLRACLREGPKDQAAVP